MNKKRIIALSAAVLLFAAMIFALFFWVIPEIKERREAREFAELMADYYNNKCDAFAEENKTLSGVEVAFIGDSLTDGYNISHYYPELVSVNRGIGGDTTHGVIDRLEVSLFDAEPELIVMLIGANNLWDMFTDYEDILIEIKSSLPNSKVILLSIPPEGGKFADRNAQIALNNVQICSLAEKYGYVYVDIFTPLYDFGSGELRGEYTTDGAHFTEEGYDVITAKLKPVILDLLK